MKNKIFIISILFSSLIHSTESNNDKPDRIISFDVGHFHNCTLFESGKFKCWGDNSFGQLGILNDESRGAKKKSLQSLPNVQLPLKDINKVIQVSTGASSTCALLDSGIIKCWGDNEMGQLGQGNDFARGIHPLSMGTNLPITMLGDDFKPVSIGVGMVHNCALSTNGKVKCWGQNGYGQLGLGDEKVRGYFLDQMGNNLKTVNLGKTKNDTSLKVTQLAVGYVHNCVILENKKAKCWGNNESGELGLGNIKPRGNTKESMGNNLPYVSFNKIYTSENMKFKSISAGYSHTCAIVDVPSKDKFDKILCWGNNSMGQLGAGHNDNLGISTESSNKIKAINVNTNSKPIKIITAIFHTCALFKNHKVKCWGRNDEGMLGIGTTENMGEFPEQMSNLPFTDLGKYPIIDISGKGAYTCALLDVHGSTKIKCWGLDAEGALGLERGTDDSSIGINLKQMGKNLPFVKI